MNSVCACCPPLCGCDGSAFRCPRSFLDASLGLCRFSVEGSWNFFGLPSGCFTGRENKNMSATMMDLNLFGLFMLSVVLWLFHCFMTVLTSCFVGAFFFLLCETKKINFFTTSRRAELAMTRVAVFPFGSCTWHFIRIFLDFDLNNVIFCFIQCLCSSSSFNCCRDYFYAILLFLKWD